MSFLKTSLPSSPPCQQDREPEERTEEGANKGELIEHTRNKCAEEYKVHDGVRRMQKVCSLESTKTYVIYVIVSAYHVCLSCQFFAVVRLKSRHSTHSIGILKKRGEPIFFYVQWKHNAQRQNWTLLSSIALNQRRLKKSPNCFPRLFSQTVLLGRKVVNVIYAGMIQKEQHKNPLLSLDSYCFGLNSLEPGKVRIPLSRWRNHQFGLTSIEPMK